MMMLAPGWALASPAALGMAGYRDAPTGGSSVNQAPAAPAGQPPSFRLRVRLVFLKNLRVDFKVRTPPAEAAQYQESDTRHSGACCQSEPRERQP